MENKKIDIDNNDIDNCYFENRFKISARIKEEKKRHKQKDIALALALNYNKQTIYRKNNNKDNSYYNETDIKRLCDLWECREKYLKCESDIKTDADLINLTRDKSKLKSDYKNALNYLKSIGLKLTPGLFWCGSYYELSTYYDDIKPFLTPDAKIYIRRKYNDFENDMNYCDHDTLYFEIASLPDNCDILKSEEITKENDVNMSSDFFGDFMGFVELRLIINDDISKTISINQLNNLFVLMDNTNKTLIDTFLNLNIHDSLF